MGSSGIPCRPARSTSRTNGVATQRLATTMALIALTGDPSHSGAWNVQQGEQVIEDPELVGKDPPPLQPRDHRGHHKGKTAGAKDPAAAQPGWLRTIAIPRPRTNSTLMVRKDEDQRVQQGCQEPGIGQHRGVDGQPREIAAAPRV